MSLANHQWGFSCCQWGVCCTSGWRLCFWIETWGRCSLVETCSRDHQSYRVSFKICVQFASVTFEGSHVTVLELSFGTNTQYQKENVHKMLWKHYFHTHTALCFERYTFRHVAGLVRHFSVLSLQAQWVMLKNTYSILCCGKSSTPKFSFV